MPEFKEIIEIKNTESVQIFEILEIQLPSFIVDSPLQPIDFKTNYETKSFSLKHSHFSGKIVCLESKIEINFQLSWFALAFKSQIMKEIEAFLMQTFGSSQVCLKR